MKLYVFNAPHGPRFHRIRVLWTALVVFAAPAVASAQTSPEVGRRLAKLASGPFRVRTDPTLTKVASRHAHELLGDFDSAHRERVKAALRAEGLADAQVSPFAAAGPDRAVLLSRAEAFAKEQARPRGPTHVGFGLAGGPGAWVAVAIFSRRTLALAPLPRRLPAKGLTVRGRVGPGPAPRAYFMGPVGAAGDGPVRALPVAIDEGRLLVDLPAATGRGTYIFQLVEQTSRGPEVAAQWRFTRGRVPGGWPPSARRATNDADGAASLLARARDRADLAPLDLDPALQRAAQAFATAMCAGKITAHQIPGASTPSHRAKAAGYAGRVAENVARAASVAEAHRNLAVSPSHRINMLDPLARLVGFGVATAPAEEGVAKSVCLVQMFGFDAQR